MSEYLVATVKSWNVKRFKEFTPLLPGKWCLVMSPDELNRALTRIDPEYIFFPHWSWVVPAEITEKYECVCFHMTDVPYGRGGSPLQNLIALGHKETMNNSIKNGE